MTPDTLARIAEAIAADERTEAANWPIARDRARLYLALARAMVAQREAFAACELAMTWAAYAAAWEAWTKAGGGVRDAFAALAPADADAEKTQ